MSGLFSPRKEWKKNGEDWQRRRRGCFRTTAYNRCVIVGWRPLVWAEAGRCNAPNKGWQSACNRLEEYLKICNRRKYHIVKEKDGFALFGGEVFKAVELVRVRWWVLQCAACCKAAREEARRSAEEVLMQGSNLQLWGIEAFVLVAAWHPVGIC